MTDESNRTENTEEVRPKGFNALLKHANENRIEAAMWGTRILTIICCLGYLFPFFNQPQTAYYKALLANGATSALRLQQRLGRVTLTREFFASMLIEDSCHYLLFSLIFLYVAPVFLVLIPVGLFAILHASSYGLTLLDTLGQNSWWGARLMIAIVEFQSRNILRAISLAEIMLMPCCVIMTFFAQAGILTPVTYYHFLSLRYKSRRNPYTRNMFRELRYWVELKAQSPYVPSILKKALLGAIALTLRLAPPMEAAAQE